MKCHLRNHVKICLSAVRNYKYYFNTFVKLKCCFKLYRENKSAVCQYLRERKFSNRLMTKMQMSRAMYGCYFDELLQQIS